MSDHDAFGNPVDASPPPRNSSSMDPESLAWMSLGFSLGGWLMVPLVLPIAGVVLARNARRQLDRGAARSATTAALWIGWINIVACVLAIAFFVIVLALFWDTNDF